MRKQIIRLLFLLHAVGLPLPIIYGQETMDTEEQTNVIESLIESLENNYVFPEVAKEMGAYLQKQQKDRCLMKNSPIPSLSEGN